MTTSFPDGISQQDLQRLAEMAKEPTHENESKSDSSATLPCGFTAEQIQHIAEDFVSDIHKQVPDPVIAKAVVHVICTQMLTWHTKSGRQMMSDGNEKAGVCWLRDAGKFQAMLNILHTIDLGDSDFMSN